MIYRDCKFDIDDEQFKKLSLWSAEQDQKRVAAQRERIAKDGASDSFTAALASDGIPYYGASGGELTFCFSPTSLGMVLVVKHSDGAELDLTDYDSW